MMDIMTAEYYNSLLKAYNEKLDKVTTTLVGLVLNAFYTPLKGDEKKARQDKIHNKYEKLYNISVDSLEDNIGVVNIAQIRAFHNYTIKYFNFQEFQFSTPVEIFAQEKIKEAEATFGAYIKTGSKTIDPKILKLIEDAKKDYQTLYAASEKRMVRLLALAEGSGLDVVTVEELLATGLSKGDTTFVAETIEQLTKGQLIQVVGKDSIARNFKSSYIVSSVARDTFHIQQATNTLLLADKYGFELIRISSHNTRTEICSYYEGGTYARNEKTARATGFEILDQYTPFHTNCLHNMLPESYDFLKMKGELDQTKAFSNQLVTAKNAGDKGLITLKPVYPKGYTTPSTRPTTSLKKSVTKTTKAAKVSKTTTTAVK